MSEAGIGSTKGRLQQNGLLQRNGLFLLPEEQPVLFPQSTGVLLRGFDAPVRFAGGAVWAEPALWEDSMPVGGWFC